MFHVVNSNTKTYFAGWKHPSADAAVQRREPIFSRRGCAFRFQSAQLAFSYLEFFKSLGHSCGVVELILGEGNRVEEVPVGDIHFSAEEIRKLLSAVAHGGIQA